MLARYGRDVAGAVKIWDPTAPGEPRSPSVIPIDAVRVREMLAEVARAPLGNATVRRMSSLAGVQDKIVLARLGDAWAEPLDGYPSTHIIKPVVAGYPSLIFDEEYGSRIARQLGLASFDTHVEVFDGISALVIERYDRTSDPAGGRIHQEDFNQVLGMSGEGKYEASGHPGLRAIADVLRHVDRRTLEQFLRMVTMSLATGNLDFHAKNISILHHPDGRIELAPAYDVVPQVHLGFDEDVALFVNGKQRFGEITLEDLVVEGRSWGLKNAEEIAVATLRQIEEFVRAETPHPGAHPSLGSDIGMITRRLLDGSTAGTERGPRRARDNNAPGGWGGPVR
jgi:serine/threonine-protein kinase HipA